MLSRRGLLSAVREIKTGMDKKVNISKFAIVLFLTALIWVWSDLALDERLGIQNVQVTIAKSGDPALWVNFREDGQLKSSILLNQVALAGPAATVSSVRRRLNDGQLRFDAFLQPEQEGMTESRTYTVNTADFLREVDKIDEYGLRVESAEPETLEVVVQRLVERALMVECISENGVPIPEATVNPPRVNGYIPADAPLLATVRLSEREIEQAKREAVEKQPFVDLAGDIRRIATVVKVQMPPPEERLKAYTITTATVGFVFSENLQGRYRVELANPSDMAAVLIKATPEAKQVYENQPFQILLEILDDDKPGEEIKRPVEYLLPERFVRSGDIQLNQPIVQGRFVLKPKTAE